MSRKRSDTTKSSATSSTTLDPHPTPRREILVFVLGDLIKVVDRPDNVEDAFRLVLAKFGCTSKYAEDHIEMNVQGVGTITSCEHKDPSWALWDKIPSDAVVRIRKFPVHSKAVPEFPIYVEDNRGPRMLLTVSPALTVDHLKMRIQHWQGIPQNRVRLIYQGSQMEGFRKISDYKVQPNDCVFLVMGMGWPWDCELCS